MSTTPALLVLAGGGGGLTGSIAGLASLVSCPALLAADLPRVRQRHQHRGCRRQQRRPGGAAGVLMLSLLLTATSESLPRGNATKDVLMGGADAAAALAFVVLGPVRWSAALPLGLGFLAGGWLGPAVVRCRPAGALRAVIAASGLALAVHLARS